MNLDSNHAVNDAWQAYQAAERDRLRSVTMQRLQTLIEALLACDEAVWHAWALDFARSSIDEHDQTPVRLPLFREILFPALFAGLQHAQTGCARWLAGFAQLLYKSAECRDQLPAEWRTEIGLLQEAMRTDPNDGLARSRLVKAMAWQLEYSLHELPSGVLYGHDGATLPQCKELQADLAKFERLVKHLPDATAHASLIADCRFHYGAYADYLARQGHFGSYHDYLTESALAKD